MKQIKIYKSDLATFGADSLIGMIVGEGITPPNAVELLFEQTPMEWRRMIGGPEEIIVPEYLLLCFAGDILKLQKLGYELHIGQFYEYPTSV